MNRVCPKTGKECQSTGCNDTRLTCQDLIVPTQEVTDILGMAYGDKKIITINTTTNGVKYLMKVCVTRVFMGWLFIEANGGDSTAPISWFVRENN